MKFKTVEYVNGKVRLIDQRLLPDQEVYVDLDNGAAVADAIRDMVVRGAPAIGVTAAFGAVVAANNIDADSDAEFRLAFDETLALLAASRPTAVNLFWAIKRMKAVVDQMEGEPVVAIKAALEAEAMAIYQDDLAINKTMGEHGATLIVDGDTVLTHCNAGALATAGDYGTALGVIKAAWLAGKKIDVISDETRPWLQGARLTMWELIKEEIPARLISDNMAGALMAKGMISKIVVGADRIAANGDVANKIGTYSVAVLARRHNIPFIVAAPMSTVDFDTPDGDGIPIEQRAESEVTSVMGKQRIAPEGSRAYNPAFDVTPAELVTAIVTEKGIAHAPFVESLAAMRTN
jgi:methylthioribose-1-phosphate isomerase